MSHSRASIAHARGHPCRSIVRFVAHDVAMIVPFRGDDCPISEQLGSINGGSQLIDRETVAHWQAQDVRHESQT